jgi:DNA-binding NarL/FixJ family response regulator
MPIRLILADDHPFILDALEGLFRTEKDIQVLDCCRDGHEALDAVRRHRPDILVLDIRMPGKDGLAVIRELQKEGISTRVVLLTAAIDDEEVLEAVRLGVHGVVLKEMAPPLLVQCIRKVHAGEHWLERGILQRAMGKMMRHEVAVKEMNQALSPREIEIVRLICKGLRNKEIGKKLFISEGTVKIHLHSIYKKLEVDGRMDLILVCQNKGWI